MPHKSYHRVAFRNLFPVSLNYFHFVVQMVHPSVLLHDTNRFPVDRTLCAMLDKDLKIIVRIRPIPQWCFPQIWGPDCLQEVHGSAFKNPLSGGDYTSFLLWSNPFMELPNLYEYPIFKLL